MAPLDAEGVMFIRDCISNEKTTGQITELLGLAKRNRKPGQPTFPDQPDVQNLYREIRDTVDDFVVKTKGKTRPQLVAVLTEEHIFAEPIAAISARFGDKIWGVSKRSHLLTPEENSSYSRPLFWNSEEDRKRIQFLIRCWIVKTASRRIGVENRKSKEAQKIPQSPLADKGRNIHKKTVEVSDGEISETEGRAGPSKPATPVAGRQALGGSFQAPRARMYPTPTPQPQANTAEEQGPILPRADPSHVATTHDELYADPPPKSKSPPSASKRKSFDGASESNRGKLPKVKNHWRGTIPEMLKNRQEDAYSVPQSPPPASDPSLHPFPKFGRRKQRESTQDSDPTYVPSREGSIESEAEPDPDSSMTEAPDLSQRNAEEQGHPLTFGHHILSTSTHRDSTYGPVQRDSVIPDTPDIGTPMPMPIDLTDDEPPPRDSTTVEPPPVARTPLTSTTMAPPSNPSLRKEKELRRELFKLLLSRLNNISPFEPGSKDHEAEGRLNQLLLHFWLNDKATIQRKLGDRFDRLYAAFDSWMDMRRRLYAFQTSTGYFGDPGEEWRLHLRGLGLGSKERAEAVIALVDLVDSEKNGRQYVGETFNDALATLFDQLTLFPACNGAEEFKGVERYNETLLQWFTQL